MTSEVNKELTNEFKLIKKTIYLFKNQYKPTKGFRLLVKLKKLIKNRENTCLIIKTAQRMYIECSCDISYGFNESYNTLLMLIAARIYKIFN